MFGLRWLPIFRSVQSSLVEAYARAVYQLKVCQLAGVANGKRRTRAIRESTRLLSTRIGEWF